MRTLPSFQVSMMMLPLMFSTLKVPPKLKGMVCSKDSRSFASDGATERPMKSAAAATPDK